jgi:hypothetical protein
VVAVDVGAAVALVVAARDASALGEATAGLSRPDVGVFVAHAAATPARTTGSRTMARRRV